MPTMVVGIQVKGDRIFIADVQESIHLAKYKRAENQIYVFADDTVPRWTTCMAVLDADTVAGADKVSPFPPSFPLTQFRDRLFCI